MFAAPTRRLAATALRTQTRSASTVSDLALSGLPSRWARLPECEQAAVAEKLLEKQKDDWRKMTMEEKKSGGSRPFVLFHVPLSLTRPAHVQSINPRTYRV
jgi:hypothetical protein